MRSRILSIGAALLILSPAIAMSQDTRYNSWSDPNAPTAAETPDGLLKELRELIENAEKSRAADPVFLRDLRNLANRYDTPWQSSVLFDDFRDGDFDRNPVWQVASGRYWVEQGFGLRSAVSTSQPATSNNNNSSGQVEGKDVAIALLGAILNQGQSQQQQQTRTTPAPQANQAAEIYSDVTISNAFSLDATIASVEPQGGFGLTLYQGGGARATGYRLNYTPGGQWTLNRVSSRGTAVVDSGRTGALEDRNFHKVQWTRSVDGGMIVSVNGQTVITTADRGFRDPFNGVKVTNSGGDFIVQSINLKAIR